LIDNIEKKELADSRGIPENGLKTKFYTFFDRLSCNRVFGISPENTTLQTQIVNLGLENRGYFKGLNFS